MHFARVKSLLLLIASVSIVGCSDRTADSRASGAMAANTDSGQAEIARWYTPEQVVAGGEVFAQNCAVCHGAEAQGTAGDWREKLADGSFPPPPLNGSAHAWHHPQEILLRVIDYGGEAMGGKMPAFIDVLDESEKLAAVAYFQDFWSDEIYQQWMQMGGTN